MASDDAAAVSPAKVDRDGTDNVEHDDEEEDDDFDFNPFLQCSPSGEASSSISSENDYEESEDVGDEDDEETKFPSEELLGSKNGMPWSDLAMDIKDRGNCDDRYNDREETETANGVDEISHQQVSTFSLDKTVKSTAAMDFPGELQTKLDEGTEDNACNESGLDESTNKLTEKSEEELLGQTMDSLPDLKSPRKSIERQVCQTNDEDVEDAICKRTRARYSLVDLSLDELETFLQESDEDDYFQNVDDEEEYRKFLAAVTQSSDGNSGPDANQNKVEDEDDDEENDADFELEIEEALESEDETICRKSRKRKCWETASGPETREKCHRRNSTQCKEKEIELSKARLRPLLPSNKKPLSASFVAEKRDIQCDQILFSTHQTEQSHLPNVFTAHQLGQLYCLINEHVQLLIQVFSLCILEPSRQQIAEEVRRMLIEIVDRRDQVLSWRKTSHPDFCFHPPFIHPSVLENISLHPLPSMSEGFATMSCPSEPQAPTQFSWNSSILSSNFVTPCNGADNANFQLSKHPDVSLGDSAANAVQSGWAPMVSGPIYSVLDVGAVVHLRDFVSEVATVSLQYQRHHVQFREYHSHCERVPLFHLPSVDPLHSQKLPVTSGTNLSVATQPQQKKTMAAALVESTKKQSVALVPAEIMKIVQKFHPYFNGALFPHKPPPVANANRVLFTDAEDELLALGLMAYNNDWKAIQERFLPCKSTHQIYVRAKNRSSSRASENSIKAVRQMKSAPLTLEEKTRITECLKHFNGNWMQVWQYCVPYRDPALLPRQWRISQGIQKSYKADVATRERRRLYEARRRKAKAGLKEVHNTADSETALYTENEDGDENSGDDNADEAGESYIHEAFIASDGKLSTSGPASSTPQMHENSVSCFNVNLAIEKGEKLSEKTVTQYAHNYQSTSTQMWPSVQTAISESSVQRPSKMVHVSQMPDCTTSALNPFASLNRRQTKTQVNLRPYRSRKKNISRTVKLAPDLPTVNLPPTVRVISRASLMMSHCRPSDGVPRLPSSISSLVTNTQVPKDTRDNRIKSNSSSIATGAYLSNSGLCKGFPAEKTLVEDNNYMKAQHLKNAESIPSCAQLQSAEAPRNKNMESRMVETHHGVNDVDNFQVHPMLLQNTDTFKLYQMKSNGHLQCSDAHFPSAFQNNNLLKYRPTQLAAQVTNVSTKNPDFHPLLQRNVDVPRVAASFTATELHPPQGTSSIVNSSIDIHIHDNSHQRIDLSHACNTNEEPEKSINDSRSEKISAEEEISKTLTPVKGATFEVLDHENGIARKKQASTKHVTGQHTSDGKQLLVISNSGGCKEKENKTESYVYGKQDACQLDSLNSKGDIDDRTPIDMTFSDPVRQEEAQAGFLYLNDDSLPGIVMEQEELSDSEEETNGNVQFECEEIGDSDGETSVYIQESRSADKETEDIKFEEEVLSDDEAELACRDEKLIATPNTRNSVHSLSSSSQVSNGCKQNLTRNRSKVAKRCAAGNGPNETTSRKKKQSNRSTSNRQVKSKRIAQGVNVPSHLTHSTRGDGKLDVLEKYTEGLPVMTTRNPRKGRMTKSSNQILSPTNSKAAWNPSVCEKLSITNIPPGTVYPQSENQNEPCQSSDYVK